MKKLTLSTLLATTLCAASAYANTFYFSPTLVLDYVSASHSHYSGIYPNFALGYRDMMDDCYSVAGEIFGVPGTATLNDSHNSTEVSTKISSRFGLAVLPGMMVSDTVLGYLRFGVVESKFSSPDVWRTGGQVGLGATSSLNEAWEIKGEYTFTAYNSMSGLGSPKDNELGLGLNYHFGSL